MRTRRFKAQTTYATGLHRARGVFRQFKATRRAFAEQIALEYLADMQRRGSYTETLTVHGREVTFHLTDFLPSDIAKLKDAPMAYVMIRITLPFAHSADRDDAFLVSVQAELDYRRAQMDKPITTYRMEPHELIAAAIRMKAAVLTAHWKHPVGLQVKKVHSRPTKSVARRPFYKPNDTSRRKDTPA